MNENRGRIITRSIRIILGAVTLCLAVLAAFCPSTYAAWSFEAMGGSCAHLSLPLIIRQEGYPVIRHQATWGTHPFEEAPYYSWRVSKWEDTKSWEFELIHDKMILENPSGDIQHFEVSHGYNYLLVNRGCQRGQQVFRVGAGIILGHPETKVRGKSHGDFRFLRGFYLSGIGAQAAAQHNIDIYGPVYGILEGKVTAAWARVPVAEGFADVPALAAHGLFGLGVRW